MALIGKNISTGDLTRIGTKVHLSINNALLEREEKGKEYNDDCRSVLAHDTALSICKTLGITVSDELPRADSFPRSLPAIASEAMSLIKQNRSSDNMSVISVTATLSGYLFVVLYTWGNKGSEDYSFREEAMAIYREASGPNAGSLRIGWTHILSE